MTAGARTWDVLLLGGPSGVGKTSVSYRLAQHYGIGITEVDDFQVMLRHMTTPEQQPVLHHWYVTPDFHEQPAQAIVEQLIRVSEVMSAGLEAVIANHLESRVPIVLEGDFLLPALATRARFLNEANDGRVRGVFLYEQDQQQLVANYLSREPQSGPQTKRAEVSWLHGQLLKKDAEARGVPAMTARPWDTVFERVVDLLSR
ncbi:MAG TPA: hypothetical protein VHL34_18600 [Rhizomicrobium sp.]|jgi:2-phosphoglycerate kinase|nr:hypothetical protein [Rhizomicrobium sp.]